VGIFKKKIPPPQERRPKPFRFELGWRGMFGLVIVCCCLFFWMFILGLWAGQTILLPLQENGLAQSGKTLKPPAAKEIPGFIPPKEQQRPMNHNDSNQ